MIRRGLHLFNQGWVNYRFDGACNIRTLLPQETGIILPTILVVWSGMDGDLIAKLYRVLDLTSWTGKGLAGPAPAKY